MDGRLPEGLGRCPITLMVASITPLRLYEKLVSHPTRGNAADSLTDCPAQHGGAKRQQLTDVCSLPETRMRVAPLLRNLTRYNGACERTRLDIEFDPVLTAGGESRDSAQTPAGSPAAHELFPIFRSMTVLGLAFSALTFDMRGGRKWAKPACGRPLDGRVRALLRATNRWLLTPGCTAPANPADT